MEPPFHSRAGYGNNSNRGAGAVFCGSRCWGGGGYTVLPKGGGEEALEIYSKKTAEIGLVIPEFGMPGRGGFKGLEEILQLSPAANVIIAGGDSIHGRANKTLEAGAAGYLGKPYQVVELSEKMRAVMDK